MHVCPLVDGMQQAAIIAHHLRQLGGRKQRLAVADADDILVEIVQLDANAAGMKNDVPLVGLADLPVLQLVHVKQVAMVVDELELSLVARGAKRNDVMQLEIRAALQAMHPEVVGLRRLTASRGGLEHAELASAQLETLVVGLEIDRRAE